MKTPTLNTHLATPMALYLVMSLITGCATQATSDADVNASLSGYELQQSAIQTLNESSEHRVASYSLAKSQCWLDVSYHEYSRNDRSDFVPAALRQSQLITDYLSAGGEPNSLDNPAHTTELLNDAERLRQDLWDTAAHLKNHAGFSCASQQVACAEVELVHAGNEHNQQGWRHAKPYVQIAEDLIGQASRASDNCIIVVEEAAKPKNELKVATETEPKKPIEMQVSVLFNFDKHTIDEALPNSVQQLESIVSQIHAGEYALSNLSLTGHADASNGTGDPNYNLLLSQKRAKAVLNFLTDKGIDAGRAPVSHKGDSFQVSICESESTTRAEYEECLLPNRRVEVNFNLRPE